MPFDPTKPIAGTLIDADELRAQYNALKDLIDAQAVTITDQSARIDGLEASLSAVQAQLPDYVTQADVEPISANNIDNVTELSVTLSNPPQQDEVQAILDKLNEMVSGLHRS
jgi:hypothetical protein